MSDPNFSSAAPSVSSSTPARCVRAAALAALLEAEPVAKAAQVRALHAQ